MTASPPAAPGMPSAEEIEAEIRPMSYEGADLTECVERILSLIRPAFEAQQAKLAQAVEAKVEIRRNDDGTIDEVVASGSSVHLEQLDKGSWHLGIYSAAGDAWQFWLSTDKPGRTGIAINHEHSPARSAAGAARGETP